MKIFYNFHSRLIYGEFFIFIIVIMKTLQKFAHWLNNQFMNLKKRRKNKKSGEAMDIKKLIGHSSMANYQDIFRCTDGI